MVKTNKQESQVASGKVLIRVENVSKKLCKDLKKSLWYGVQDFSKEMIGRQRNTALRDKEFWAVDDVSFELRKGQCLGLMGANGAGKSTLLKMLNGLIKPDKGKITLLGRVGALIELNAGFNPILTGRENTYINGAILGFSKEEIDERFESILAFSEIGDFIDSPMQNYSSGMKVRLGFAIASHLEPDILLIDEVLAVGDMGFRNKCINKLKEMIPHCCVVFVSHITRYTEEICSDILLLEKGKTVFFDADVKEGIKQYEWMTMSEKEREGVRKKEEEEERRRLEEERNKLEIERNKKKESAPITLINCGLFEVGNPENNSVFEQFCELEFSVNFQIKEVFQKYAFGFSVIPEGGQKVMVSRSKLFNYPKDNTSSITLKSSFKNNLLPGSYSLNLHFIGKTVDHVAIGGRTTYEVPEAISFTTKGITQLMQIPIQLPPQWVEVKPMIK